MATGQFGSLQTQESWRHRSGYAVSSGPWKSRCRHRKARSHRGRLVFEYPCFLDVANAANTPLPAAEECKEKPLFHIAPNINEYNAVTNTFLWNGMLRTAEEALATLYWGKPLKDWAVLADRPWQRVNHFPGTIALGSKSLLTQHINRMQTRCPDMEAIQPLSFSLPQERSALEEAMASTNKVWIFKPSKGSCGAGIRLLAANDPVPQTRSSAVVSEYIANPMLVDGVKFDMRIYVALTSFDPLRVYVFDDGLVRFATEPYSGNADLSDLKVHLTNFSVNKGSDKFKRVPYDGGEVPSNGGSKWSYKALVEFLGASGVDIGTLQSRIDDLITNTLIAVEHAVVHQMETLHVPRTSCFELLGFDIMLDDEARPWLLEVNTYPSLSSSSKLDKAIKTKLSVDLMHVLRLPSGQYTNSVDDRWRIPLCTDTSQEFVALEHASPSELRHSATIMSLLCELMDESDRSRHFRRIFPCTSAQQQRAYASRFLHRRALNSIQDTLVALDRHSQLGLLQ